MSKKKGAKQKVPQDVVKDLSGPPPGSGAISMVRKLFQEPVALGVALLVVARPWRDGLTYPAFNTYFLWGIILLAAVWAIRALFKNERIHGVNHILLLGLFVGICVLTAFDTVQIDATYRGLLYWAGYFFLFVLTANALKTRRAINIVLTAFLLVVVVNAGYSILHLYFVLPYVRSAVDANPDLIGEYFSADSLDVRLAHRLAINRAFGTFLFPNALGAFLIVSFPFVIGEAVASWRRWKTASPEYSESRSSNALESLIAGGAIWLIMVCAVAFIVPLMYELSGQTFTWSDHILVGVFFLGLLPILVAGPSLVLTRKRGCSYCWMVLKCFIAAAGVFIVGFALFKTYSRGSFLAFFIAAVIVGAMLWKPDAPLWRRLRLAGAVLLILVSGAFSVAAYSPVTPVLSAFTVGQNEDPNAATDDEAAPPDPRKQFQEMLKPEGIDLDFQELLRTNTFRQRIGYWTVALLMARDHIFTGVGLGNFGTVYPKYRVVGAGEVQVTHNDYLQLLAETGVFGALAFIAFWGLFLVYGARHILRETDTSERWLSAGIYAGILAFLLHSLVDFDFYNPSLSFFPFLLAGVFLARARLRDNAPPQRSLTHYAVIPLLIVIGLAAGAGLRVYVYDFLLGGNKIMNVGDSTELRRAYRSASYYIEQLPRTYRANQPQWQLLSELKRFVPSRAALETFGMIGVPVGNPPNSVRQLSEGESPPDNALFVVRRPQLAQRHVREGVVRFLERLETIDAIYPYGLTLPQNMYLFNELLYRTAEDKESRRAFAQSCVDWTQRCVDRSPQQYWNYILLGKSLIYLGNSVTSEESAQHFIAATDAYKRSAELYGYRIRGWKEYIQVVLMVRDAFRDAGDMQRAQQLTARAREADKIRMDLIHERREFLNLPRKTLEPMVN